MINIFTGFVYLKTHIAQHQSYNGAEIQSAHRLVPKLTESDITTSTKRALTTTWLPA